jgi:phenylalanyl-tRNA synthetase alpha chain
MTEMPVTHIFEQLDSLLADGLDKLSRARQSHQIEDIRIQFLGKKGRLTEVLRFVGQVAAAERPQVGQKSNQVKTELGAAIEQKLQMLKAEEMQTRMASERADVSLPGTGFPAGHRHPISRIMDELVELFGRMGYSVAAGPDVEDEWHNFEALNIPPEHPSRDMHDTFYLTDGRLLRTHTSPVQIHALLKHKPPIRILAPGRVYRCDNDASHSPIFHQIEGLAVDRNSSFADLKGTLSFFAAEFFGPQFPLRFRPSFFPFTEPSAEMDIGCVFCQGSGCGVCKRSGWIEILGCGMVDPAVLSAVGLSWDEYQGFAFGMGIERMAMLRYGIPDIKLFYENDERFVGQF